MKGAWEGLGTNNANFILKGDGERSNHIEREDHLSRPLFGFSGKHVGPSAELRPQQPSIGANPQLFPIDQNRLQLLPPPRIRAINNALTRVETLPQVSEELLREANNPAEVPLVPSLSLQIIRIGGLKSPPVKGVTDNEAPHIRDEVLHDAGQRIPLNKPILSAERGSQASTDLKPALEVPIENSEGTNKLEGHTSLHGQTKDNLPRDSVVSLGSIKFDPSNGAPTQSGLFHVEGELPPHVLGRDSPTKSN
jgi:hypothetical protein